MSDDSTEVWWEQEAHKEDEAAEKEEAQAHSLDRLVRCGECGIESDGCGVVNDGKPICWECYMKIMDNILSKLSPAKETAPNI